MSTTQEKRITAQEILALREQGHLSETYCKLRFVSKYHHGSTAELIFSATALTGKTISDLSRYFPTRECNKMDRLERSPFFATWEEAFAYTFTKK